MPNPEEDPVGSSAQKSSFRQGDSDQFQIGTRTRSRTGRTIHRHRDQAWLEKARKIASSKAAKADLS